VALVRGEGLMLGQRQGDCSRRLAEHRCRCYETVTILWPDVTALFNTNVEMLGGNLQSRLLTFNNDATIFTLHISMCESMMKMGMTLNGSNPVKTRIDKLLVERGLVATRERAQAMILAGRVLVMEQKVTKSGASFDEDVAIRILGDEMKYVSRGGLKLERALQHWGIELSDAMCADIGASTGGFTDCMLQSGARGAVAIDTGYGQIDMKLRNDPRVRLMEKTNARYLEATMVPESVEFVAMDVSFISATLVLPAVIEALWKGRDVARRELVLLVKPQFEVGRENVGKGGIVRDSDAQLAAVEKVKAVVEGLGGRAMEVIDSPILGTEGNREFLLHSKF
jgi:23S rRNA (cytidine1920-2'-O)/16S rRNA (cytidine1409-2'-O)-methyltransferase